MLRKRTRVARMSRDALWRLALCVALLLVVCGTLLKSTVWNELKHARPERFDATLPGVDLTGLTPESARILVRKLNLQRCRCDCGRTVASCRNNHRSCTMSLMDARAAVEAARK